jgi:hypothetical protein
VAAVSGDGQGRGRSTARAACRGEGGAVVHSGKGRPEVGERRWPWSSVGRPWQRLAPVAKGGGEKGALGSRECGEGSGGGDLARGGC